MKNFPELAAYGYKVEQQLGQNFNQGRVTYLAQDLNGDRQVVLKQFQFNQGIDKWDGYRSIEAEVNVLQRLNDPQIPDYIASFTTEDSFYLVMEYIDAPTLADTKNLTFIEIKAIAIQLLHILKNLQQQQPPIIHRDIKPENILLRRKNREWEVFLIDFGFARLFEGDLSASSTVKGTLGFMPPEQLFQRELTTASDLYSLGVTLIATLCNKPSESVGVLIGSDYRIQVRQQLNGIPDFFMTWLEELTDPNPDQRYRNAQTALRALLRLERSSFHRLPTAPTKKSPRRRYRRPRHPALIILQVIISIVVITAVGKEMTTPTLDPAPTSPLENAPVIEPETNVTDRMITDLYQKGLTAYRNKLYDPAVYYYEQVNELDPNHFDALSDKCAAYYYLNQYETALAACEKAIAINDQDYSVYNRHGLVLTGGLNRPAEALDSFKRSQELNPGYFWAWVNNARALTSLGKYNEAIDSAEHGIKINPDASGGWYEKCKALRKMGALSLALESCNQATYVNPESDWSWDETGRVLYAQQEYDQALRAFHTAISLEPDRYWTVYRLGLTQEALGNTLGVIATYQRAVEIEPNFAEALQKLQQLTP